MAAADYYQPGVRPPLQQQQSSGLHPPLGPQRASSNPSFSYHLPAPNGPPVPYNQLQPHHSHYPPPPYQPFNDEQKPSVHFAPTPSPPSQHRPSNSNQPRPDPYIFNQPHYAASNGQQLAPYQQQYIPPNYQDQQQLSISSHPSRPHNYSMSDTSYHGGYVSDPERHRRKHKHRPRRTSDNSRSTTADSLLGAAGGSLIGDLLFPGLGTVGGALVGWVGGKDYGKHRKWREDKRDRDQGRWEKKYHRERSGRSSSSEGRKSSHDRRGSSRDSRT